MTVADLICALTKFPMTMEVVRSAGEDLRANVDVGTIEVGPTFVQGTRRSRKAVILR